MTEEHKRKIGLANKISLKGRHISLKTEFKKGFKQSKETIEKRVSQYRGSNHWLYKKHHSQESRFKMSLANKGEKCGNWKGGISSINARIRNNIQYRLWREAVLARDHWNCQNCGQVNKVLHVHHIKSFAKYPELRFAIDNGITLCRQCHQLTKG